MASSVKDGCEREEDLLDDLLHKNHEEDNDLFEKDEPVATGTAAIGASADANHSDISDEESHHDDEEDERGGGNGGGRGGHSDEEDISEDEADEDRKMADRLVLDNTDPEPGNSDSRKPDDRRRTESPSGHAESGWSSPDKTDKVSNDDGDSVSDKDDDRDHRQDHRSEDDDDQAGKEGSPPPPKQQQQQQGAGGRKGKSYDYATKLNYLFRDARFFVVKSNNAENVALSKAKGVWSTPPANESRLNKAFDDARNVLLIFSVKESGKFSGFARLATESRRDGPQVSWVLPPGLSARALGGVFKIDWVCRKELSFNQVQHLYNPWNEGKPIKIGRDGQEIEPRVAEELCRLFPCDDNVEMTPILRKSKDSARRQRLKPPSSESASSSAAAASAARRGPVSRGRPYHGGPPPHHHRGGGGAHDRKRRSDSDSYYSRPPPPKYSRSSYHDPDPRYTSSHHHSYPGAGSARRSYDDYLRTYRTTEYHAPHSDYYYSSSSRGYYESSGSSSRYHPADYDRRDYDRSVDEFLRKTSDGSRDKRSRR